MAYHLLVAVVSVFLLPRPLPPRSTLFPYTTLFRSLLLALVIQGEQLGALVFVFPGERGLSLALRSEEHTSELQSHSDLVCRLLLEKKKNGHAAAFTVDAKSHPPPQHPVHVTSTGGG